MSGNKLRALLAAGLVLVLAGLSSEAVAQGAAAKLNEGNTAWILTSTVLVLFMTLPGLALFYGGLVRSRNVISVLMHCFTICCLASVLWLVCVYSLAFGDGGAANQWIGGFGKAFLAGVGGDSLSGDIPETGFFMFQMTFAIITPGSGFVGPMGGLVFGIAAGAVCYICVILIKQTFKIDDSLDVFAVHGVGGVLGTLLTGIFAAAGLGGVGLAKGVTMGGALWVQFVGVVAVLAWDGVISYILLKFLSAFTRLRVDDEEEMEGLDITSPGERGYNL